MVERMSLFSPENENNRLLSGQKPMQTLHDIMLGASQSGELCLSMNTDILQSNLLNRDDPDNWASQLTRASTDLQWNYDFDMDQKR